MFIDLNGVNLKLLELSCYLLGEPESDTSPFELELETLWKLDKSESNAVESDFYKRAHSRCLLSGDDKQQIAFPVSCSGHCPLPRHNGALLRVEEDSTKSKLAFCTFCWEPQKSESSLGSFGEVYHTVFSFPLGVHAPSKSQLWHLWNTLTYQRQQYCHTLQVYCTQKCKLMMTQEVDV